MSREEDQADLHPTDVEGKGGESRRDSPRPPPEQPTAEELKLKAAIEETRKLVKFKKADVKDIVSHHSSSILSKDDPEIPHDPKLEALSRQAFKSSPFLKDEHLSCGNMPDLISTLYKCGFNYLDSELSTAVSERLNNYLHKLLVDIISHQRKGALSIDSTIASINENDFVILAQKFNAPAYYFGQRLRRLVARAQLTDAIILILRGCNVNTSDGEGLSSIHYACEYNRHEVIDSIHSIVKEDLVINAQDKYGWTPMHCACHHGNLACVQLLLKLGASITKVNKQGKTPFHLASAQCRREIVSLLIQHDPSVVNVKDNMDVTALMDAAFRGHHSVYSQLLETEGIDVNHKDRLNYSARDFIEGSAIAK